MQIIKAGGLFMIPLIICSILTVAIIAERLTVYAATLKTALILADQPELVVKKLRQRMVVLHTIITISPMLGLLGTLTGLMKSFYLLSNQVSAYNPRVVSTGISEALLTTAVGLVIAVVATIFYNYFNAQLENYVEEYNTALNQLNQKGNTRKGQDE